MRIEPEILEKIDRGLVRHYRASDIETQRKVMIELIMEFVPADSVLINCFKVATGCYTARMVPEAVFSPASQRHRWADGCSG